MFNEEKNIGPVLDDTLQFLNSLHLDFEILVVNDGSTDRSTKVVKEKMAFSQSIKLLSHPHNRGMGAGMRTGIMASTKETFIVNAADGQVTPRRYRLADGRPP